MPFQLSGREDDVVVGAFALAEDDVFDSGLDDLSAQRGQGLALWTEESLGFTPARYRSAPRVWVREQLSRAFSSAWMARQMSYPSP